MTLTLGGRSEGQALHTSSDVMGRYRFPLPGCLAWLGPINRQNEGETQNKTETHSFRRSVRDGAVAKETLKICQQEGGTESSTDRPLC